MTGRLSLEDVLEYDDVSFVERGFEAVRDQ